MKSDNVARAALEGLGFAVRKLSETNTVGMRADFIAKYGQLTLLVEAKLREDQPEELKEMNSELADGKVYGSTHKLGKSGALTKKIRRSIKQLDAEMEEQSDYKVLLYLADCINSSVVSRQIVDTLYGSTSVLQHIPGSPGFREIQCYFYRENEFHLAKSLDAVIVGSKFADEWVLTLCLNPFSNLFDEISVSTLAKIFEGRTINPIAEEAQGNALIPDHDAPRPSGIVKDVERMFSMADGMLRHLERKYGYETHTLLQGHFNNPIFILRQHL